MEDTEVIMVDGIVLEMTHRCQLIARNSLQECCYQRDDTGKMLKNPDEAECWKYPCKWRVTQEYIDSLEQRDNDIAEKTEILLQGKVCL